MSQNVPGSARTGHSRWVARSWPDFASGTGLEPGPVVTPERLGAGAHLVEREPAVEVARDDHGVHQVVRDVLLIDEVLGRQLGQWRLVAVPAEVPQSDRVV